jgi:hypothetical protein
MKCCTYLQHICKIVQLSNDNFPAYPARNSLLGALHRLAEISLKRSKKSSTISYYMYTNPQSISTVLPQCTIVGKQKPELACYAVINICSRFTIWEAVEETTITNTSSFLQLHSLPVLEVSCTLTINLQHW